MKTGRFSEGFFFSDSVWKRKTIYLFPSQQHFKALSFSVDYSEDWWVEKKLPENCILWCFAEGRYASWICTQPNGNQSLAGMLCALLSATAQNLAHKNMPQHLLTASTWCMRAEVCNTNVQEHGMVYGVTTQAPSPLPWLFEEFVK